MCVFYQLFVKVQNKRGQNNASISIIDFCHWSGFYLHTTLFTLWASETAVLKFSFHMLAGVSMQVNFKGWR